MAQQTANDEPEELADKHEGGANNTYKARNAVENGVYECGECGTIFRLENVGEESYPNNYDINCPLCGHFLRKE